MIGTPGPGKPVRYGVRLRFGQIQVRVGSRFATMEGADAVARAFRATVSFGRDNGEASLNEAKLVEYSKEFVECFTKYNNVRERVSITSVIRQWLKTWTIRGQQKRKRKMVEQTRKEKNLRAAQELTRAQMNAFQNANMGQRIIGVCCISALINLLSELFTAFVRSVQAVDFGNNHMHQQNQLPNSGMAPQHSLYVACSCTNARVVVTNQGFFALFIQILQPSIDDANARRILRGLTDGVEAVHSAAAATSIAAATDAHARTANSTVP